MGLKKNLRTVRKLPFISILLHSTIGFTKKIKITKNILANTIENVEPVSM